MRLVYTVRLPVAPTVSVPISVMPRPPIRIVRSVRSIRIRIRIRVSSVIVGIVSVTPPAAAAQQDNEQNQAKHDDPREWRVISSARQKNTPAAPRRFHKSHLSEK